MNKTININLGGLSFHIDEDAYQKLSRYFEAIKLSLSKSGSQDEIVRDIELRIAELFTEWQTAQNQVITLSQVDQMIGIMGQPEDYKLADEPEEAYSSFQSAKPYRKLYRDTDRGMIGGVSAGLSHYFGLDTVWIRIIFALVVFLGFGTGLVIYLILWIVTPAASTTAEKLEMTGQAVNISNIERKVREEFDNVSNRLKNINYDEMGKQFKTGGTRVADNFGGAMLTIIGVLAKVLGAFILFIAASTIIGLLIGLITMGSSSFVNFPWYEYAEVANYTSFPLWTISILTFLAVGIPFIFLFILGIKLVAPSVKAMNSALKYVLLTFWILAIAALIFMGVQQSSAVAYDAKTSTKESLNIAVTDTLKVKFRFNDLYSTNLDNSSDFKITRNEQNQKVIYSNNVEIIIATTEQPQAYLQIEKNADGASYQEARSASEKISYKYDLQNNTLILDNYFIYNVANKFRNEKVKLYLYLPENQILMPDSSLQYYDNSDRTIFDSDYSQSNIYKVKNSSLKCISCADYQIMEKNLLESDSVSKKNIDSLPINNPEKKRTRKYSYRYNSN